MEINKNIDSSLHYVLWEVTQKCNLKCIHCRADASPDKKEKIIIKGKKAFELIDEIKKLGAPTLALTGGEPLLRKDLIDIIKYANKQGVPVRIQSNGLLLTERLASQLKNLGILSFGIGLDGPNAEIHDRIRNKKGAFKKAIKSIKLLKSKNIKVHVEYTITKINYNELTGTLDLLESLNVDTFLARAAIFAGRANANNSIFRISNIEYKKILEQICSERQNRKILLNSQDPLYHLSDKQSMERLKEYGDITSGKVLSGCTVGLNMAHIHSNGEVGVCTFLPDLIIGNIFKKSFSQIWEERARINEINRFMKREYNGACKNCSDRFICGGCRARALIINKDLFGHDPYCWKYCNMQQHDK